MDPPLIFDGHNDTLLDLILPERGGRGFFERDDRDHLDLPRAREGCFGGGFFACWAPPDPASGWIEESALTLTEDGYEVADAPPLDPVYAQGFADDLADCLFRIETRFGGRVKVVRTAQELEPCLCSGVLAAVLHFEGAENFGPDPGALEASTRRSCCARSASCGAIPTRTGTGCPFGSPPPRTRGPA